MNSVYIWETSVYTGSLTSGVHVMQRVGHDRIAIGSGEVDRSDQGDLAASSQELGDYVIWRYSKHWDNISRYNIWLDIISSYMIQPHVQYISVLDWTPFISYLLNNNTYKQLLRSTYISEGGVVLNVRASSDQVAGVGVGFLGLLLGGLNHIHLSLGIVDHCAHRGLHLYPIRQSQVGGEDMWVRWKSFSYIQTVQKVRIIKNYYKIIQERNFHSIYLRQNTNKQ